MTFDAGGTRSENNGNKARSFLCYRKFLYNLSMTFKIILTCINNLSGLWFKNRVFFIMIFNKCFILLWPCAPLIRTTSTHGVRCTTLLLVRPRPSSPRAQLKLTRGGYRVSAISVKIR